MEQLKVWDIGHIYAPYDELKHLKKAEVIWVFKGDGTIFVKTKGLQRYFLEANEFVKSELYNNPKPMKPKAKPIAKKATPKQVWRPLGEFEKVYKWDVLRVTPNKNYWSIGKEVTVTDDSSNDTRYFYCLQNCWDKSEYLKENFLTTRPLEVNIQYLRSDWLLFTKDKIGIVDVQYLKNEHKRIGDLLSEHNKYFK